MTADFAADINSALVELRELAESLMTATVRFSYKTGRMVQNEATGKQEPIYATRFETKAKFQSTGILSAEDAESGAQQLIIDQLRIDLPWNCPGFEQDDEIVCLTNPHQPRLVGRVFMAGASFDKDFQTATRLTVREKP